MAGDSKTASIAAKLRAGRRLERIAKVTRIILRPIKWPLLLFIYSFGVSYDD